MKNIIIGLLLLSISCKESTENKEMFSNQIDYQYLMETNNTFNPPMETYKIRYDSDGLEITGFITKPKMDGEYPVIIYNRGGNRNVGIHTNFRFQQFLASNGYIVLSTQLRGNLFSEGKDEMGGADLNDILKLIEIAKSLPFAKPDKIGVFGISRGGLNAYQISRLSDDIKAIAVIGAPVDPRLDFDTRPGMYNKVYQELVGDTIENKDAYDYRSPLLWTDEINEPTLILHGSEDWRVKPINAELMIAKFKELNKEFDYQIVKGGNHGLDSHRSLRNDKILGWFAKYLK